MYIQAVVHSGFCIFKLCIFKFCKPVFVHSRFCTLEGAPAEQPTELLSHFFYFGYLLVEVNLGYPENLSFLACLEVPCNTIPGGLGWAEQTSWTLTPFFLFWISFSWGKIRLTWKLEFPSLSGSALQYYSGWPWLSWTTELNSYLIFYFGYLLVEVKLGYPENFLIELMLFHYYSGWVGGWLDNLKLRLTQFQSKLEL